jgi:titin
VTDVADTPPGQPAPPTFTNIAETGFRILWSAPTPGSSPVDGVGLQYKPSSASDEAWADVKPAPGTGRRGFNLTNRSGQHVTAWADVKPEPRGVRAAGFNLTNRRGQSIAPGTSYDVRVRAQNAQGWGEWSEAGTVTTAGTAQVQPAQPAAPAFTEVQETRFRILWQAPTPGASPITGYGLQYKLTSASDEAWADVKPEPRGVRAAGFNLTNRRGQSIAPGTSYDVRVRAQNAQGWGEWSEAGTVTTAGTAPAGS